MTTHKVYLKPAPRGQATMWLKRQDHMLYIGQSKEPLFAAARELLERGLASEGDHIVTQWEGEAHWSMRSPVGVSSGLTVHERSSGGITMAKHYHTALPMSETTEGATTHA